MDLESDVIKKLLSEMDDKAKSDIYLREIALLMEQIEELEGKIRVKENIIKSFDVKHGAIKSVCYTINNKIAYASDVSFINKKNYSQIYKLKYFIIDCLREEPHPSHYSLNEILSLIKEIKPETTILTNLHSSLDYKKLKKKLPKSVLPAYDGMKLIVN